MHLSLVYFLGSPLETMQHLVRFLPVNLQAKVLMDPSKLVCLRRVCPGSDPGTLKGNPWVLLGVHPWR